MTLWTRENVYAAATRRDHANERALFEAKRRERQDERSSRARLCRVESGTVIAFPTRPPVGEYPDEAA